MVQIRVNIIHKPAKVLAGFIISPLAQFLTFLLGYSQLIMSQTTKITPSELEHLAQLTALQPPKGAVAIQLCDQLSQIISYVSQVQEFKDGSTMVVTGASTRLRPDEADKNFINNKSAWLKQTPVVEGDLVITSSPFNKEENHE